MRYTKSLIVVALVSIFGLISCLKDDNVCKPISAAEEDKRMQQFINGDSLQNFIALNELTVEHDANGFYYIIVNPGSTSRPNINNTVRVEYVGTLTDFRQFDKSNQVTSFELRSLIEGWQLGLPKIGQGGRIILILPPSLAYGCNKIDIIDENSVLVFDLTLHNFQ